MGRDIDLNIHVTSDNSGLDDTGKSLDHVGGSADKAGTSMHKLGDESGHVDANITRLKGHIHELTAEFDRTGNTDLLKDIGSDKSALRRFEGLAKTLTPAGEEGGKAFNRGFLSTLGELGSNLRGSLIPIAIGAGVLISPVIGAAVAGAVTGAIGLGGIAGGIFAAAQDPAVKQAAHHFAEDISDEFTDSGKSMVQPVIASLDILKQGFKDMDLDEFFAKAAPHVTELATALSGMFTSMMPGLNRAMDQLGPVMDVMVKEFPELGAAIGDMIGDMAESKGAIEGLHFVFEFLEGTLRVTGSTVAWLGDRFHDLGTFAANATGMLEDIPALGGAFKGLNDQVEEIMGTAPKLDAAWAPIAGRFDNTARAADDTTSSVSHLTMTIDELKNALDELFNKQMGMDKALLETQKDTLVLKAAVDAHGASLKTNTSAGLDNRDMILGLVEDYEKQRDAAIKAGKGTAEATRKFDDQVAALETMLIKLGFSRTEIDKLLGAYKRLHDQPDIKKEIEYHVKVTGQTGALARFGNVGMLPTFDKGGMVPGPPGSPQPILAHGGEFVLSREMLSGRASAGAASVAAPAQRIDLHINTSGAPLDDLVGELVRKYVYFRGGDPVTALAS